MLGTGTLDECLDRLLVADVGRDRESADLLRDRFGGCPIEVGDDDRAGAVGREPTCERASDAAARAGDDTCRSASSMRRP